MDKAQAGDISALPTIRKLFANPVFVDAMGGDLAYQAQSMLIAKFAGKNLLFKEAVPRKMERMRTEIGGPNPSPLESLLVERIVSTWLHLHHLELTYCDRKDLTLDLGNYYQRSIARAQRNYLSAIKALAHVRKLALPAVQVNFAKTQVNVLNTSSKGESKA